MEQWGLTASATATVTFPIKMTAIYAILMTTKATTFRYSPWPSAITTSKFTANSDSEPAYWCVFGKV